MRLALRRVVWLCVDDGSRRFVADVYIDVLCDNSERTKLIES